jgi:hypothetical protein
MAGKEQQNPFHHTPDQFLVYKRAVHTHGFIALGALFRSLHGRTFLSDEAKKRITNFWVAIKTIEAFCLCQWQFRLK